MSDQESPLEQEDPLVMYLIIPEALNLSIGKVGVSTAHAATTLAIAIGKAGTTDDTSRTFWEWYNKGAQRKVSLKADAKEWEKIKELLKDEFEKETAVLICDAGLVEVAKGAETCIGLMPRLKSQRPKLIKRLQALK